LAAAAVSASGCVVTNDICIPLDRCEMRSMNRAVRRSIDSAL
jgi:hypothetical protein